MSKLTTDVLLKESIKAILTELVNSTYDWQEYSDEEIGQIVELDPTQVAELSAVINDSVAAKNKVYSSQYTKELIQQSVIESNQYADDLVANLSNIKLDIVDALPDSSTVNKSTIYILKDSSGGTNNTLNVWSDTTSAFVEVGKLNVSMDNYYTKAEVDAELVKKANADEVLKPDAIVADLTTTSGSTTLSTAGLQTELDKKLNKTSILTAKSNTATDEEVYSAKALNTELDKKANDDEVVKTTGIATTIDSTSTDDKIPSTKAVFNECKQGKLIDQSTIDTYGTEILKYPVGKWYTLNTAIAKLFTDLPIADCSFIEILSTEPNTPGHPWNSRWSYRVYKVTNIYMTKTYYRSLNSNKNIGGYNDTGWQKVCTTSVADVPETRITFSANTNYEEKATSIYSNYEVADGICYVLIYAKCLAPTNSWISINDSLPRPKRFVFKSLSALANATDSLNCTINKGGNMSLCGGTANGEYITTFSYHVAG